MIGYLKGTIIEKRLPEVWVEVAGVGYRVKVGLSQATSYKLQDSVEMFIHTAVR